MAQKEPTPKVPRDQPQYRPLRVYAFDPTHGRALGNYMTVNVVYEPLQDGPAGQYLKVVDYDASNRCYYPPVNLDDPYLLINNGLAPSEADPRFHQQMVYAVASETIRLFEYALGRKIRWRFNRFGAPSDKVKRLRIYPHAMQEANAYYSRDLCAMVFGYFAALATDVGDNLPGQTVFTCLSHDIVAHETAHALVDSQRDFFMEPTGPDAAAFHEAFADIVALFQHFSYKDALLELIQRTGGRIYQPELKPETTPDAGGPLLQIELQRSNPLVGLAKQFGDALGKRKALREALGTRPDTNLLATLAEPHERGGILVAAVFDAFFSIYMRRVADLLRIARIGDTFPDTGDLHPDLANRLADTAAKTAGHFFNICVRALDYCPPVDIRFGDFLRALITADSDLVTDDPHGYRAALIDAFRSRGIRPEGVRSYAEESLLWVAEGLDGSEADGDVALQFDVFSRDPERVRKLNAKNGRLLHAFAKKNPGAFGFSTKADDKIWARNFYPVARVGPDGQLRFDVVAEIVQRRQVRLDENDPDSPLFTFCGGATLILTHDGQVRYLIGKPLVGKEGERRLRAQREYLQTGRVIDAAAAYTEDGQIGPLNFSALHRGY